MALPSRDAEAHRIFVVEDHPIVRRGLADLIAGEKDLRFCGEAADSAGALAAIPAALPDLVIVDLSLRSVVEGLELIARLHRDHPRIKILVASMHEEEVYAERTLRAGAHGYVGKHESAEHLLGSIRTVLGGGLAVSPEISERVLRRAVGHGAREIATEPRLSDREFEVFAMIGLGLGTREIAGALGVSRKTIETHRERIKQKLGISSATELVARAVRFRLEIHPRSDGEATPRSAASRTRAGDRRPAS
jgi:DNA-binding NarL/FixJ family response regulator